MITVVDCGDPTANMSSQNLRTLSGSSPSATTFSSVLLIVCAPGSYFLDFSFNQTIICTIEGAWTELPFCGTSTIACHFRQVHNRVIYLLFTIYDLYLFMDLFMHLNVSCCFFLTAISSCFLFIINLQRQFTRLYL